MKALLSSAAIVLALTGCSLFAPPTDPEITEALWQERQQRALALTRWDLRARAALTLDDAAYHVSLGWRYRAGADNLLLEAPFGQGVVRMNSLADGGYRLQLPDGNELRGATPEQLFVEVFGWELPVSGLRYWIRGIPRPGSDAERDIDSAGRLRGLSQDGWVLTYSDYFSGPPADDLPKRLRLSRDDLIVKLVIERWQAELLAPEVDSLFPVFDP